MGEYVTIADVEAPLDDIAFVDRFVSACQVAVAEAASSQNETETIAVRGFYEGYLLRKRFPWLGESGGWPGLPQGRGLTFAIAQALASYRVDGPAFQGETEKPPTVSAVREIRRAAGHLGESVLRSRVAIFLETLIDAEIKVDAPSDLVPHVLSSFVQYSERAALNLSSDPW